jgi:HNH endonuclease
MPRDCKGRFDLANQEWRLFLAECWERGEAPADEAWKRHLRRAAHAYLRRAHNLLAYAIDPEWEAADTDDEAADHLIAWLNRGGATFRMSGLPVLPFSELDDEEVERAWDEREGALRKMPHPDYLLTPEWVERRRGALRRAGHECQTCGADGRLHVHHRTYERRGQEWVDDLVVLCEDCHLAVHLSGGSHRPRNLA